MCDSCAFLSAPSVLMTVNFQSDPTKNFQQLLSVQPTKPLMVMEFWPGWFDHWGHPHLQRDVKPDELVTKITTILQMGGSFNLYMFHGKTSRVLNVHDVDYKCSSMLDGIFMLVLIFLGGTNFGFMNGANIVDMQYRPDVTSYG